MEEKYMIDRLIAMAKQCERSDIEIERLEDEINDVKLELEKAHERIAILESVELLSELKVINDAPNT